MSFTVTVLPPATGARLRGAEGTSVLRVLVLTGVVVPSVRRVVRQRVWRGGCL
jgi:hypothetical protein